MGELSKKQINMYVRAIMPELYRIQEIADWVSENDEKKPYDQQHQRGHGLISPRINYYQKHIVKQNN